MGTQASQDGTWWETLPCAAAVLDADARVVAVNGQLVKWLGRSRADVEGAVRLPELLTVGGRIYWETHLAPLLQVEGRLDEVALELMTATGPLPVLLSARTNAQAPNTVQVALTSARERVRFERELRAARSAAEHAAARVALLLRVSQALSNARTVATVVEVLVVVSRDLLGRVSAALLVQGADGPPRHAASYGSVPRDLVDWTPEQEVPLRSPERVEGVLLLGPSGRPGAEPLDNEVLEALGRQAGLALDRARLFEHHARVAHELQHSLLAVDLPADPRLEVATVYRPGVAALEVGGDWFDVFTPGAPDDVRLVVGDVVGRGIGAASAMGQLRSAVRALAGTASGPAALLTRLDDFVDLVPAAAMATLAYLELDLERGQVRYACAGHPPPVLVPADGPAQLLWEGRSTPLGSFLGRECREQAGLNLEPGDSLLVFTDGLFERRDRSLDIGLELVRRATQAIRPEAGESAAGQPPLENVVRTMTASLLADEQGTDDVCVLLVRWDGPQFARDVPASLTNLAETRHELDAWLAARAVAGDARRELVLATSEAIANAGEHGHGLHPEQLVRVQAGFRRGGRDVVVRVTDAGAWRTEGRREPRGRGLAIMRALVDDVHVETGAGTTVVLRKEVRS